jgi:hypothetical protein
MKTKIYILFFLLICASFQVNSQTVIMSSGDSNAQRITNIKALESRYFDGKVYLHLTVNGNTETKILAVERSLDGKNYEVIGYIEIHGNNAKMDLAYYFTDESPVVANLYYRLSGYTDFNEPIYSETINVIPVDKNKTISGLITTNSNSEEQKDFIAEGTK